MIAGFISPYLHITSALLDRPFCYKRYKHEKRILRAAPVSKPAPVPFASAILTSASSSPSYLDRLAGMRTGHRRASGPRPRQPSHPSSPSLLYPAAYSPPPKQLPSASRRRRRYLTGFPGGCRGAVLRPHASAAFEHSAVLRPHASAAFVFHRHFFVHTTY